MPCECDNPVGDPRELTCLYCGHQIGGVPLPTRFSFLQPTPSEVRSARPRRRFNPAP